MLSRQASSSRSSNQAQPDYPSSNFRWSLDELTQLTGSLQKIGLLFTVSLAASGPVWKELAQQVAAHCEGKVITIPDFTTATPLPETPTALPFILLAPGNYRRGRLDRSYDPYDQLDVNEFTTTRLLARPFSTLRLPLADPLSELPMLMIGRSF